MSGNGAHPAVFVLACGAAWEATALTAFADSRVVVLRRCVDVADLMAGAATGLAAVAVVDADSPGLDAEVVRHLAGYGVRIVAVGTGNPRLARIGIGTEVSAEASAIVTGVLAVHEPEPSVIEAPEGIEDPIVGLVVAVWGPTGAPGRTSVALGLAGEITHASRRVLLIDADPYGGTAAQRLGILDESSGLLGAARLANTGRWERSVLAGLARCVGGFEVLTGLPRADRRIEVRSGVLETILDEAARYADVIVDCGFGLEDDGRDRMTLEVIDHADVVVAVGSADPVGLTRFARGLADLTETGTGARIVPVLNRWRPRLGWDQNEVRTLLASYVGNAELHLVPDDPIRFDRAEVSGRAINELGPSEVRAAFRRIAADALPDAFVVSTGAGRRAGRRRA